MTRILLIGLLTALAGCTALQSLTVMPKSPYDNYISSLAGNHLDKSAMAQAWTKAGELAHHDSIFVNLPFSEYGFFPAAEPQARFYRFNVKAGQVLTLTAVTKSKTYVKVFIDLFSQRDGDWKNIAYADSLTITHEFDKNEVCLVRLQPELLANVYYTITLSVTPVLLNPVKGANNKSIGSYYNDPRDNGARKHEGIDIFAPKGTLVVAPTDGYVSRVGNGGLGGKTVWMYDSKRNHSYYFAHLDSQLVKTGDKLKQGDALGLVGNTGNAKYTPSHLHFGVYQNSSRDPIAYIRTMEKLVNELAPDTTFQSLVFRTNKKANAIHLGPDKKTMQSQSLPKDTYVKVIARSNDWYRVMTADNQEGFIEKSNTIPAEHGNKLNVDRQPLLLEPVPAGVPMDTLSGSVESLAAFGRFRFVRTGNGTMGWLDIATLH